MRVAPEMRRAGDAAAGAVVAAVLTGCSGDRSAEDTAAAPSSTEIAATGLPASTTTFAEVTNACSAGEMSEEGMSQHSIESGGIARTYLVYVPDSYDGTIPWPVIISLHGRTVPAEQWFDQVWRGIADDLGHLLVLPEAIDLDWAEGTYDPDVPFVGAVVDDVSQNLCIDELRIYASGGSDGADMVTRLACDLSDRIVAARPFAGGSDPEVLASEACDPHARFR